MRRRRHGAWPSRRDFVNRRRLPRSTSRPSVSRAAFSGPSGAAARPAASSASAAASSGGGLRRRVARPRWSASRCAPYRPLHDAQRSTGSGPEHQVDPCHDLRRLMLDQRGRRAVDPQLQRAAGAVAALDQLHRLGAGGQHLTGDLAPARLEAVGALAEAFVQRLDQPGQRAAGRRRRTIGRPGALSRQDRGGLCGCGQRAAGHGRTLPLISHPAKAAAAGAGPALTAKEADGRPRLRARLLAWYDANARELPWRTGPACGAAGVRPDPYRVWLSEVMLQQTTVPHATPYFLDFTARWPTVQALAAAPDERGDGRLGGARLLRPRPQPARLRPRRGRRARRGLPRYRGGPARPAGPWRLHGGRRGGHRLRPAGQCRRRQCRAGVARLFAVETPLPAAKAGVAPPRRHPGRGGSARRLGSGADGPGLDRLPAQDRRSACSAR